jgi:F-box-like
VTRDDHFMTKSTTRLPPELTDHIIDFLHSDRRALATCALVCRSWISSSRLHFCAILNLTRRNTRTFITLLHSNDSTIEKYAYTLQIGCWRLFARLAPFLGRFLTVKSLVLRGTLPVIKETDDVLCLWLNRITNLDISLSQVDRPKDLVRFIDAFSSLEILYLDFKSNFNPPHRTPPPSFTSPPCLRTLHIALSDGDYALSRLFCNTQFSSLVELELCRITPLDVPNVAHMLHVMQPTLRILKLELSRSRSTSRHIV